MRPVAVYSALRVGLFLAALLALRLLGVSGLLSVVVALLLSMLLSFVVLRRQRDAVTRALMDRRAGRPEPGARRPRRQRRSLSDRIAEDAAAEDAAVSGDGTQAAPGAATPPRPRPGGAGRPAGGDR